MEDKEKRSAKNSGRRLTDKVTPGMVVATALVNLSGAPARRFVTLGMFVWLFKTIGDSMVAIAHELKGDSTWADIKIRLSTALSTCTESADINTASSLGVTLLLYVLGALLVILGIVTYYLQRERRLRQQVIDDLSKRVIELEESIDQRRSSSGLANTGETHPRDRHD